VPPKIKDTNPYHWFTVNLNKEYTFKLRDYVRRHPIFTEAYSSAAINELVIEALNSKAVQRNIEFVRLLEDMQHLSARDKSGMVAWQERKDKLLEGGV
jgi:formylmethanofuran:tetrahydromethanopterin formyltransferase